MIEGAEQTLLLLRAYYTQHPDDFDLAGIMPAGQDPDNPTMQVSLTDAAGIMKTGNLPIAGRVDLSDREHIRVHFNTPKDELFISKPVLGRVSKKWSIQFTRKAFGPDGRFDEVLVLSIDANYLSRFYRSLDIGNGSIILAGLADGVVRSRAPNLTNAIGGELAEATMHELRSGPVNGHYQAVSRTDKVDRIYSYRRLDKYGLVVIVGLAAKEAFANYDADRVALGVGGVLSAIILFVGTMLVRQQRRLLRSQATLTATPENMSQGIAMVDKGGTVQVINQRAAELLSLPPELAQPGVQSGDILRWQAARHDFDADPGLAEAVGSAAARGRFVPITHERTRPNGTSLEVRTQSLPDGGLVRTFTDITGRKAAEATLRATLDRLGIAHRVSARRSS